MSIKFKNLFEANYNYGLTSEWSKANDCIESLKDKLVAMKYHSSVDPNEKQNIQELLKILQTASFAMSDVKDKLEEFGWE